MPARHKLMIDADPGIGDAVAIALALIDPEIEVLALTACGGLVSGEQAFRNLQTIVSLVDPELWPRLGWSEASAITIDHSPAYSDLVKIHGETGLGECQPIAAKPHQPTDSAKLMADMVKAHPGELTLLTMGPLTNVVAASELHPEFLNELNQLVVLGGSVASGGDVTAAAEFNILADPYSARGILKSSANKTLLPLDTSQKFGVSFDQYRRLNVDQFSRLGSLLDALIPFALRASRSHLGQEGIVMPEVMAIAAVAHSELFERTPMTVDVETDAGLTKGMTVFDRRSLPHWKQNIEVLTDVDPLAVMDYLLRLIAAE